MVRSSRAAFDAGFQGRTLPGTRIEEGIRRLRGEYLEMPGLHLTREQVQRLWGLDAGTCDAVIDALVDAQFLRRTQSGAYVRVTDGGA